MDNPTGNPRRPKPVLQWSILILIVWGILWFGILAPVFRSAKTAARHTQASRAVRDTGRALRLYAQAFDGYLPPHMDGSEGSWAAVEPFMKEIGGHYPYEVFPGEFLTLNQELEGMKIDEIQNPEETELCWFVFTYPTYERRVFCLVNGSADREEKELEQ